MLKVDPEALIKMKSEVEEKTVMVALRNESRCNKFILSAVSREGILVKIGNENWTSIDKALITSGSSLVSGKSEHEVYEIELEM